MVLKSQPDMNVSDTPPFSAVSPMGSSGALNPAWGDVPLLALLEGVGDGVWDLDLATGREYFSPRLKAMYGHQDSDDLLFAIDLDALTHPDDVLQMFADRESHLSGQVPSYRNEHRVRHQDGRWIWVLSRGLVVARDANGAALRMVGTHTDITERKHAELELRSTRERLELATQGSSDGLWDQDMVTGHVFYSQRFQELLGYGGAFVFEDPFSFSNHLHPEDADRVLRHMQAHWRGERAGFDEEFRLRCRTGEYRWFHGRGMVTRAPDGRPLRFAGHMTDLTEKVKAQAAQRVMEERLHASQKLEAIGNLAHGVSRSFGEALDHILRNAARARQELPASHPALTPLLSLSAAAESALGLVTQMQVFSRRQPQRMAVLDFGALVARSVASAKTSAPTGITLRPALSPDQLYVLGDATQLHQGIVNLLAYAAQALSDPIGEVDIAVAPAADGAGASLVVHNTGPGTPAEAIGRLFEPFFPMSGDGGSSGSPGGLGLAVVLGVVEAHQGRITVTSQPGRGTRFEVWLPRVVAPSLLAPPPVSVPAMAIIDATQAGAHGADRLRHVVYIDDYEAMVYLVTRMLKKKGYRVSAFERAEEALNFIEANPNDMDLLVTDYNMPGFSGLDVVRRVKLCRPDVPMVITSGHVTPGMLAEALNEGVNQVLNKQESVEELADILAHILESLPPRG